ncbi:hypothetical protein ABC347_07460 [Sphingomonas sp. 1P06PA]|uniref:hypothetical protein n=1 Tax=Sphingomonas sp. 1P06PA TaxID=554121 RepID=UPI0039A46BE5
MRIVAIALAAVLAGGAAPAPRAADTDLATFETLRLSAELARAAERRGDPLLMLAAARLRRSAAVRLASADADRSLAWIAQAERMGSADPRVLSLAADLRTEATKGRASGPRVSATVLRGGEQRAFVERFAAGRPAVVYLEGDGDSDLALRVGTASAVACRDLNPGDVKICAWTPRGADPVKVEVVNVGTVQNRFILGTN